MSTPGTATPNTSGITSATGKVQTLPPAQPPQERASKTARVSSALKSGVVYGGTALLSAVNGITPHLAGAVDVIVVEQPDGSRKSTPFYVRFGKYTPMRTKDRTVKLYVNDELVDFHMHLGTYGHAYFAAETVEMVSEEEEDQILSGMMSPPSGYSSGGEADDVPYANSEVLTTVAEEAARLQQEQAHGQAQEGQAADGVASSQATAAGGAAAATASEPAPSTEPPAAALQPSALIDPGSSGLSGLLASSASNVVDSSVCEDALTMAVDLAPSFRSLPSTPVHHLDASQHAGQQPGGLAQGSGAAGPGGAASSSAAVPQASAVAAPAGGASTSTMPLGVGGHGTMPAAPAGASTVPGMSATSSSATVVTASSQPLSTQVGFPDDLPERGPSTAAVAPAMHTMHRAPAPGATASTTPSSLPLGALSQGRGSHLGSAGPVAEASSSDMAGVGGSSPITAAVSLLSSSLRAEALNSPTASACSSLAAEVILQQPQQQQPCNPAATAASLQPHMTKRAPADAAGQQPCNGELPLAVPAIQVVPLSPATATAKDPPSGAASVAAADAEPGPELERFESTADHFDRNDSLFSDLVRYESSREAFISGPAAPAQASGSAPGPAAGAVGAAAGGASSSTAVPPNTASTSSSATANGPALPQQGVTGPAAAPSTAPWPCSARLSRQGDSGLSLPSSPGAPAMPLGSSLPEGYLADLDAPKGLKVLHLKSPSDRGPQPGSGAQGAGTDGLSGTSVGGGSVTWGGRRANTAPASGLLGVPASGMALQGLEISLCYSQLRREMTYAEVAQIFEANKISAEAYSAQGVAMYGSGELMVRLGSGGPFYPWAAVAPALLGMLAFGVKWDQLVLPDMPCWLPPEPQAAVDSSKGTPKKSASGWKLWPFGGWQRGSGSRRQLGTSPPGPGALAGPGSVEGPGPGQGEGPQGQGSSSSLAPGGSGWFERSSSAGQEGEVGGGALERPVSGATEGGAAGESGTPTVRRRAKKHRVITRKALNPSPVQLAALPLKLGQNTIRYRVGQSTELLAYVYYYKWHTKLVVSDIDGTITKSDVLGHLLPAMGWDWSHAGITKLFVDIETNGYTIMYLSSRSISQSSITRDYINTLVQDGHRMPIGPVIISPHGLLPSLYREMILRRPHEFKIATLQDIRNLFPPDWNPFYSGFGNRDTDEISYREVGVPLSRIFIINPKGELRKASSAVISSALSSLAAVNDLVHEVFPPLVGKQGPDPGRHDDQYNDLQYWGASDFMRVDVDHLEQAMKEAAVAAAATASSALAVPEVAGSFARSSGGFSSSVGSGSFKSVREVEPPARDFIRTYNPWVL